MRSGAAAGHTGYFHETAFYDSDDELAAIVVPFLRGGQEAGEPTLVTLNARNTALVREALGDVEGVAFVAGEARYRNPARTIVEYRAQFGALAAAGAEQIRIVGDVPHPGTGGCWQTWSRYEAAATSAFAEFPLWGLCPYDTRTSPDEVLEDVRRTHPHVALADGRHVVNDDYDPDPGFVRCRHATAARADGVPDVLLDDPTPAQARRAVGSLVAGLLRPATADDLVLAVSEVVANAHRHGAPPVLVELWAGIGRAVVAVRDGGGGLVDPLAGLESRPARATSEQGGAGVGLWIAHQLVADVALEWHDGFTVRLEARD